MKPSTLAFGLSARLVALGLVLAASSAFAQNGLLAQPSTSAPAVAPGTTAADVAAPGLPGPQSADPAPGAKGAYAGHSEHAFYDVDARIEKVQGRIDANLTGADQRKAASEIASIKAEEKQQIARHGDLLDWARENLNHRLDTLVKTYPALQG